MEAQKSIRIQIPYKPRPLQAKLHTETARFKVIVCHRRFGKTVWSINEGLKKLFTCKLRDPRVLYLCPFKEQAERNAWDYLLEYSDPIPGVKPNKSKLHLDFPNDGRFVLGGADNSKSWRGSYWDYVILDEVAQMAPTVWTQIIRPALADRLGGAAFIGTPYGRANSFYRLYQNALNQPDWFRTLVTADQSGIIDKEELESLKREMPHDEFMQEMMCSWDVAIKGSYYAKFIEQAQQDGRISSVPHEPTLPVHTICDLGMRDAFAVWFVQFAGTQCRVIRYREFVGMSLPEYVKMLDEVGRQCGYKYGEHVAPHDIRVKELGTGVTRWETASKLGLELSVCRNIPVMDGIDAAKSFLARCWFDEQNCIDGIDALRSYRSEYDEKREVYSSRPLHDWASHGADAFRYCAVHFDNPPNVQQQTNLFRQQNRAHNKRAMI